MLSGIRKAGYTAMKISTFEYFIKETIASLRFNGLMSIASISTVALSLLILGMFLIMVLNMNHIAASLESQVQISVYVKDGLSDAETKELGSRIAKLPGVVQANYVGKDEALVKFKQRLGEQQGMLEALGDTNPLPNAFDVVVRKPDQVQPTAAALAQFKEVETTQYEQRLIEHVFSLARVLRVLGVLLVLFLAFAATFIIANTIRITVFARRREIGIMKYVGATDWFIRWPFLLEGMVLGFGGALVAALLLGQAYGIIVDQVYKLLAFFPILPKKPLVTQIGVVLLMAGTLIGALGSTISLRRFMKV